MTAIGQIVRVATMNLLEILRVELTQYKPGSAGARSVMAGAGSAGMAATRSAGGSGR